MDIYCDHLESKLKNHSDIGDVSECDDCGIDAEWTTVSDMFESDKLIIVRVEYEQCACKDHVMTRNHRVITE